MSAHELFADWERECFIYRDEGPPNVKRAFAGEMRRFVAEAWWLRVRNNAEDDRERLSAAQNLASSLHDHKRRAEAEAIYRAVLGEERGIARAEAGAGGGAS